MCRARIFTRFFALAAAMAALAPAPSYAYKMFQSNTTGWSSGGNAVTCNNDQGFNHWDTRYVTWYLNPSGQGWNKAAVIQAALQTWTNAAQSDFVLSYGGTRSNGYRLDDGLNMLVWGIDGQCDSISCHAITSVLLQQDTESGRVITQSDILFNANSNLAFQWMTNGQYTEDCWNVRPGIMLDTQGIATHELGHSIGLHHPEPNEPSYATATMSIRTACTTAARTLDTDDLNALTCMEQRYPESPVYDGVFNGATCASITGWSRDDNQPTRTTYVEIVEDMPTGPDRVFATVLAIQLRADIPGAGPGTRLHGFTYPPDAGDDLFNRQWHTINVRHSGTGESLFGGPKQIICGVELLAGLSPNDPLSNAGLPYEVATQFSSSVPGRITALGHYFSYGETGAHTIRLWTDSGVELIPGGVTLHPSPFFQGIGWSWVDINPVSISANTLYRVSINTWNVTSKTNCGLSPPYVKDPLKAHQGVWAGGPSGTFPNTGSCSNFFVSVRFDS